MGRKRVRFHTDGDLMARGVMVGGSSSASALQLSVSPVQPKSSNLRSLWLKLIKRQGHHAALVDSEAENASGMSWERLGSLSRVALNLVFRRMKNSQQTK